MNSIVLVVFIVVYLGMILGRLPWLALDRTGVALLGAILLIVTGVVSDQQLISAVDVPTIVLLFGLMVLSGQFRLSGFYSKLVRQIGWLDITPGRLLALFIAVVGVLSAVLANDIVCLAMTPVIIEVCIKRRLDPKPFLLALACAANVGSAATLIGNPQNILIGQVLNLSFSGYMLDAILPSAVGLVITWAVIARLTEGKWKRETKMPQIQAPAFNRWQTYKGMFLLVGILVIFLANIWPRDIVALAVAAVLLCSRKMRSRDMLGLIDWQLLVLFISLFVVNYAVNETGYLQKLQADLSDMGVDIGLSAPLFIVSVFLSNLVSNVPAVMLLLKASNHPAAGSILALSSTLAGNLLVVGSIANIIVIDQAARLGIRISWREHARIGVPVTLLTLGVAALWLWFRSF